MRARSDRVGWWWVGGSQQVLGARRRGREGDFPLTNELMTSAEQQRRSRGEEGLKWGRREFRAEAAAARAGATAAAVSATLTRAGVGPLGYWIPAPSLPDADAAGRERGQKARRGCVRWRLPRAPAAGAGGQPGGWVAVSYPSGRGFPTCN